MRKFNWLMTFAMLVAVAFASCTKDKSVTPEPEPGPEPGPTPELLTFEAEIVGVTRTTATFNVTPSNLEADYMAVIYSANGR